ncbi:arsenic resistance protein [Desulfolucanica intricata]|uniref:arsenic resistance protein n=1 Tax=Desulfolucanica intricata TaxID=1285191 RepID=UPI0008341503|nr:bile acid:sodium symporter [Desulfolucanica intricata]
MLKKLFMLPSKKLNITIPLVLTAGFVAGLYFDTASLKSFILPVTILMIYPTMIGIKVSDILNTAHIKLFKYSFLINFIIIPISAYIMGTLFLLEEPQLFAGLAIASLLPTSNMTIAFTMFAKGNVPAAITLTVLSLILGSILAPWYLLVMVGKYIPINFMLVFKTIILVVFTPMIAGMITYSLLLKKYSEEQFKKNIKPYLPAASAWGMMFIVFTSISTNTSIIIANLNIFIVAFLIQIAFYLINYTIAVVFARSYLNTADGYALVYSTALRNLSISIGLAATAFGANAALMVALAFIIQGQAAAYFAKLNEKYQLLKKRCPDNEKR